MRNTITRTAMLVLMLGTVACTQSKVKPEEYSGFLGNYSRLKEAKSPDGEPVMRWVSPDLKAGKYSRLMLDPVTLYPHPAPTPTVSEQVLYKMTSKLESDLRRELGAEMPIVNAPGPKTLRLRVAITGVDISNKGFKPYEILPIALVMKGAILAAGQRTQEVGLYQEVEVTDSQTGEVLAQVVRKDFGEELSNKNKALTQADADQVLLDWAKSLRVGLHDLK